jgi:hypothetical protein
MQADQLNDLSYRIIGAGIEVHRGVGPGLLESTYRTCMIYELRERGMSVVSEHLRHTKKPLGLLMNFNVAVLADGVERIKNGY